MSENTKNILAVKVDVDTLEGYLKGVPAMVEVLNKLGLKASFYFSFGPDNSGKAIFRIFRKGFISKMFRTKAPSTYGLKTMMYGTLLPAPMIVKDHPQVFIDTFKAGHECGVHAWDHVKWQDKLPKLSYEEIRADLLKAVELFEKLSGQKPRAFAAPGWQITANALAALDSFNFDYVSNGREGKYPFYPAFEGKKFKTLEIASTLPTMDEILGLDGVNDDTVVDFYLNSLKPGLNVITVHGEMEGRSKIKQFEAILRGALKRGYTVCPMRDVAQNAEGKDGEIVMGYLKGRAGKVAIQK